MQEKFNQYLLYSQHVLRFILSDMFNYIDTNSVTCFPSMYMVIPETPLAVIFNIEISAE